MMNWMQFGVETAATVIEVWVILSTVTEIAESKYTGWAKFIRLAISTFGLTVFVSILNVFDLFSFVTIVLSVLAAMCITRFTTNQSARFRLFSTILVFLSIHAIDYIVLFAFGLFAETPITDSDTFSQLFVFGKLRCWYLLIDKGVDVLLYMISKKHLMKLQIILKRYLTLLLVIVTTAYVVMSILLSLILSNAIIAMQAAIIFSWLFMLLCVCIFLYLLFLTTKYQDEKARNELLDTCNSMMEENYQRLNSSQQTTARLIHDFNHHVNVLRQLAQQYGDNEISDYLDTLLASRYQERSTCKSDNDALNAIINCKISEAQEYHIKFQYKITAKVPSSLPPVDLCAILANQIDNAFDACKEIEDFSQRETTVHIWQNSENLFLFQVTNSVQANPFTHNPQLSSTKTDRSYPHGLGLKSIEDTAEKYGGILQNRYRDGRFISTVFLNLYT